MGGMPVSGVIWQHIHYIVGLQRLGHNVFYIEDTDRYPYNPIEYRHSKDTSYAVECLQALAKRFGFEGKWAYCARYLDPFFVAGMSWSQIAETFKDADCAFNLCGSHVIQEEHRLCRRLALIDSDPGVEQIRIDSSGTPNNSFARSHDVAFTFGENIGTSSFPVPLHGIEWHPTRQPVVLSFLVGGFM
jgi:hypothetical protein